MQWVAESKAGDTGSQAGSAQDEGEDEVHTAPPRRSTRRPTETASPAGPSSSRPQQQRQRQQQQTVEEEEADMDGEDEDEDDMPTAADLSKAASEARKGLRGDVGVVVNYDLDYWETKRAVLLEQQAEQLAAAEHDCEVADTALRQVHKTHNNNQLQRERIARLLAQLEQAVANFPIKETVAKTNRRDALDKLAELNDQHIEESRKFEELYRSKVEQEPTLPYLSYIASPTAANNKGKRPAAASLTNHRATKQRRKQTANNDNEASSEQEDEQEEERSGAF